MTALHAGIYSFPFRLYISEPLPAIEVSSADAKRRIFVYKPQTMRPKGMPLTPDVPFAEWPGFAWNPGVSPKTRRLRPPANFAATMPSSKGYYDTLRVDCRRYGGLTAHAFVTGFLAWLRQLTLQPWIGQYEPQTDSMLKYGFRCDADGRAIETPSAFAQGSTGSPWIRLISASIWDNAAQRATDGEQPELYWGLFCDSQLHRTVGRLDAALLFLALSLEVARDRNFPRFAESKEKRGIGTVLGKPFQGETDLLQHLSTLLAKVHPDRRNLEVDCPEEWTAVRRVYTARHKIAHGGPSVVLDGNRIRPATENDVGEITSAVYRTLRWIEAL